MKTTCDRAALTSDGLVLAVHARLRRGWSRQPNLLAFPSVCASRRQRAHAKSALSDAGELTAGGPCARHANVPGRPQSWCFAPPPPRYGLRVTTFDIGVLTDRECAVLELVAEGRSNREIGHDLLLAEETVKHHVKRNLGRLTARSRAHAVAIALREGLIE